MIVSIFGEQMRIEQPVLKADLKVIIEEFFNRQILLKQRFDNNTSMAFSSTLI